MILKILQLNMWAGNRFSELKDFLSNNTFDILCFQEVAGKEAYFHNIHCDIDCFKQLQIILNSSHVGKLAVAQYIGSNPKTAYFGNAIFYRRDFLLLSESTIPLLQRSSPYPTDATTFEDMGRSVLDLTLQKEAKTFNILSTHLALAKGTKIEQPFQKEQNKKLIHHIKTLKFPFILTGDFNIDPNQPTVLEIGKLAKNLTTINNIQNTIDPKIHGSWEKISPGVAIDYIFIGNGVVEKNFTVSESTHISDHFALIATVEV